jgi:DNA-directed RNA polymerase specialized sigma24 family protein
MDNSNCHQYLCCLDHLRKNRNRRENDTIKVDFEGREYDLLNQVADNTAAHNPEKELLHRELSESISRALRRLTPHEHMVFDLKHSQGMKLRDVSVMLNTSEGSVKTSLVRATRKPRLDLAKYSQPQKVSKRRRRHEEDLYPIGTLRKEVDGVEAVSLPQS